MTEIEMAICQLPIIYDTYRCANALFSRKTILNQNNIQFGNMMPFWEVHIIFSFLEKHVYFLAVVVLGYKTNAAYIIIW